MEAQENKSAKKEPLVSFRKADILNGENTVIYGLDMEVLEGEVPEVSAASALSILRRGRFHTSEERSGSCSRISSC